MSQKTFLTVVADEQGEVFEYPDLLLAGMNGTRLVSPSFDEMIPLPDGSRLFTLPGTGVVGFDAQTGKRKTVDRMPKRLGSQRIHAVSAFLTPGYTRTLLPAADYSHKTIPLPLWSYSSVGWCVEDEKFYTTAVKIDSNKQWLPEHFDDRLLEPLVKKTLLLFPDNRLFDQLARCAIDYHCFAAKNLFFQRWEAPLPTSPTCNSRCIGCISLQESECCPSSQDRLNFIPSIREICEVAVPHLREAENAIVSFGQGCEGDPIMQWQTICSAVKEMRRQTSRGTINFNSNASIPTAIPRLAEAGIQSIRVSLNSAREDIYNAYYRPCGYAFGDVVESLRQAKKAGLYIMLNYLVFPGVSDCPAEIDALINLIEKTGVDMIQMRNLSIDPTLYLSTLGITEDGIGMLNMLEKLKLSFPSLQYGYFNRTRETFFPPDFQNNWPICNDCAD